MLVPSSITFRCDKCGYEDGVPINEETTGHNENNVQFTRRVMVLAFGWVMTEEADLCPCCKDN